MDADPDEAVETVAADAEELPELNLEAEVEIDDEVVEEDVDETESTEE